MAIKRKIRKIVRGTEQGSLMQVDGRQQAAGESTARPPHLQATCRVRRNSGCRTSHLTFRDSRC